MEMNNNFASILHGLGGLGSALNQLPNYHPEMQLPQKQQQQPAAPKKNEQKPTGTKQPVPQKKIQQTQGPA